MKADIILGVLQGQYELAKEAFLADPQACAFVLRWAAERNATASNRRYQIESVRRDGDQFVLTLTDVNMAEMREAALAFNASGASEVPMPVPPVTMQRRESVIDFFAIFRHMVLDLTEGVT